MKSPSRQSLMGSVSSSVRPVDRSVKRTPSLDPIGSRPPNPRPPLGNSSGICISKERATVRLRGSTRVSVCSTTTSCCRFDVNAKIPEVNRRDREWMRYRDSGTDNSSHFVAELAAACCIWTLRCNRMIYMVSLI